MMKLDYTCIGALCVIPPPPPPGAAGGHPPAMFPEASSLPIDKTQLVSWQVIVVWVDVNPAGDSSEQESPCDSQNRRRPMDMNNSLNNLVYNAIQRGPVGPQEEDPLALCWFSNMLTLLVGMLLFRRDFWARLAQKLKNHLHCGFLFMPTMLASGLIFTALWVLGRPELNPTINHIVRAVSDKKYLMRTRRTKAQIF